MRFLARAMIVVLAAIAFVNQAPAEEVVISGQVLGEQSGMPLPAQTWIAARNATTGEWARLALSKGGESAYRLVVPSAGRYHVYPIYGSFWYDDWDPQRSDILAERAFEVTANAATTELDLTLPDPVRVRLRVVDASGDPLEGAEATLSRMRSDYERDYGAPGIPATTNEDGRCEWFAKPGNEIWVSAQAEGFTWKASEHFEVNRGDNIEEITLKLRRPGTISATLVDADAHPMPNTSYRLAVYDLQGAYLKGTYATTDANGRFVAPKFLVRDRLRIALHSSSKNVPDFETIHEGPADHDLGLGSVHVTASSSPTPSILDLP